MEFIYEIHNMNQYGPMLNFVQFHEQTYGGIYK